MKRPPGVIIDVSLLFYPPLFHREALLYMLNNEGFEIVGRSFLGRATTRQILRETNYLHYFDDLWFNDRPCPDDWYEVSGPFDDLFYFVSRLTALYMRGNPLTSQLSLLQPLARKAPATENQDVDP